MSFLKRLFGGSAGAEGGAPEVVGEPVAHKGFTIRATPFPQDGQYQTCGIISKEIDGARKEHKFIRADRFPSADLAADQAVRKGKQIIDEQGEALFG
ncbi:HlyU family transcriptional regulator [Chelativorans sp. M5D2P16]|uniref:HlyU family transcriptional regulator n=1 Tax=Chelativorans sp. M5D2P16 TaxID=3095678 RepID=UPI002ACAAE00|nr:HlyU family transcriptional regulator [Chelativorans sp. M5D2P16]MDZ5698091.1 HlyU family transcriptional regulator [Chelativorans sp. M5D2P16]